MKTNKLLNYLFAVLIVLSSLPASAQSYAPQHSFTINGSALAGGASAGGYLCTNSSTGCTVTNSCTKQSNVIKVMLEAGLSKGGYKYEGVSKNLKVQVSAKLQKICGNYPVGTATTMPMSATGATSLIIDLTTSSNSDFVFELNVDKSLLTVGGLPLTILNELNSGSAVLQFTASAVTGFYTGFNATDFNIDVKLDELSTSYTSGMNNTPIISNIQATNPIVIQWTHCPMPLYEVQVLRLYNVDELAALETNIKISKEDMDWTRAIKLFVSGSNLSTNSIATSTQITLTEGTGYYVCRVRGIGTEFPGGAGNHLNYGVWSATPYITNYPTNLVPLPQGTGTVDKAVFYYNQFDRDKNWISSKTIIEGNEAIDGTSLHMDLLADKIEYYNGLGMPRQSMTKLNSTTDVVVSNMFQDFNGRTVITTLPTPIFQQNIKYVDQLAGSYAAPDFDDVNLYTPQPMAGLISQYYGNLNSNVDVPNAEGYPFSRAIETNEGIGRLAASGLAGAALNVSGEHNTRHFIDMATSSELQRIFGVEAPPPYSVLKELTVNPNQQISVKYTGTNGKVLATCLSAGQCDALERVDNDPVKVVNEVTGDDNPNPLIIEASLTKTFTDVVNYISLDYLLLENSFRDQCGLICKTCDYHINLVAYKSGDPAHLIWQQTFELYGANSISTDPCTNPPTGMNSIMPAANSTMTLAPGEYTFKKTVTVGNLASSGLTNIEEYQAALRSSLEQQIWNAGTLLPNWDVYDAGGTHVLDGTGAPLLVNLTKLQTALANNQFYGPNGVYQMLMVDYAHNAYTDRILNLRIGDCKEEIMFTVESCKLTEPIDPVAFSTDLIAEFQNALANSKHLTATSIGDHVKLYNVLFEVDPAFGGNNFVPYTQAEVATMLQNMVTAGNGWYTSITIQQAWTSALAAYLSFVDLPPATNGLPLTFNFLHLFLQSAGYHVYSSSAIANVTSPGLGYKSHPFSCLYYPQASFLPTSSWPSSSQALANGFGLTLSPPCSNVFAANVGNSTYPALPVSCATYNEATMNSWATAITSAGASAGVAGMLPPNLSIDETRSMVSVFEQECKRLCQNKSSQIKYLIGQEIELKQESYTWTKVEDISGQPSAFASIIGSDAASNWIDVMTQQVIENCQSKCTLTVSTSGGVVSQVGTPQEIANFQKAIAYDIKLYSTKPKNTNAAIGSTLGATPTICTQCLDANDLPLNSDPDCLTDQGTKAELLTCTYEALTGNPHPSIDGHEYCGCCPEVTGTYSTYPVESTDPTRNAEWSRRLMHMSDRTVSSTYNLCTMLTSEINAILFASGSTGFNLDIYDKTYNYLNPISDAGVNNFTPFFADNNSGGSDGQLPSDPGTNGRRKEIQIIPGDGFEISVGTPEINSYTVGPYTIKRKQYSQLGLHGEMHVSVTITPDATVAAGDKFVYKEDLSDYGSAACISSTGTVPALKFTSNRNFMEMHHQYAAVPGTITFEYDVRINKDNAQKTFNLNNQAFWDAFKSTCNTFSNNTGIYTLLATYMLSWPSAPINNFHKLKIKYSASSFSYIPAGGAATTPVVQNYGVDIPLLRQYDANKTAMSQDLAPASMTDYLIEKDYLPACSTMLASPPMIINNTVQALDLVRTVSHFSTTYNVMQITSTKLWTLSNFKINWPSIFCMQYVEPTVPAFPAIEPLTCEGDIAIQIMAHITAATNAMVRPKVDALMQNYVASCMPTEPFDLFTVSHELNYYYFTTYYYDRAGNLIRTVMPKGCKEFIATSGANPLSFATYYTYNSLGQVITKQNDDEGLTQYAYDYMGRIRVVQDAEQVKNDVKPDWLTYTKYDALGRATETAEYKEKFENALPDRAWWPILSMGNARNLVTTTYTEPHYVPDAITGAPIYSKYYGNGNLQSYLYNRISYAISDADAVLSTKNDQVLTVYSYDVHGNINWNMEKVGHFPPNFNRQKYDLLGGTVLQAIYNEYGQEKLFHKYTYDADKRLRQVFTSRNGVAYTRDAQYNYFRHGPLQNVVLGHNTLQKLDYAYTINGWSKGLNNISLAEPDPKVGVQDVFAYKLHYFEGDFDRSVIDALGNTVFSTFNTIDPQGYMISPAPIATDYNLYDGNIAAMYTGMAATTHPLQYDATAYRFAHRFKYDEINRLLHSYYYEERTASTVLDNATPLAFQEDFTYDLNGNITTAKRYTHKGLLMDDFDYNYASNNNNRLQKVTENATDLAGLAADFDIKRGVNNYDYDRDGNLNRDGKGGIYKILWNQNNRVTSFRKDLSATTSEQHNYLYNALGQRAANFVYNQTGAIVRAEVQGRDAGGNLMADYSFSQASATGLGGWKYKVDEEFIYGSNRLGSILDKPEFLYELPSYNAIGTVTALQAPTLTTPYSRGYRITGERHYEITDHLGNVRYTLLDVKYYKITPILPVGNFSISATCSLAMHSYSNMYAYGMPKGRHQQQGQSFCYQTSTGYAFGFNGQIKTDNISGEGNHNTALFWEYDTRLGRRWNVDPVDQISLSNYACFGNNPISRIDPMGNTTVACSRNPSDGQVHTVEGISGSGNSQEMPAVVCHAKPKATAATSSGAGSSTGGGGGSSTGGGGGSSARGESQEKIGRFVDGMLDKYSDLLRMYMKVRYTPPDEFYINVALRGKTVALSTKNDDGSVRDGADLQMVYNIIGKSYSTRTGFKEYGPLNTERSYIKGGIDFSGFGVDVRSYLGSDGLSQDIESSSQTRVLVDVMRFVPHPYAKIASESGFKLQGDLGLINSPSHLGVRHLGGRLNHSKDVTKGMNRLNIEFNVGFRWIF
jgi:hypothetical protein